jgi:Autotransporter beta-domain
LIIVRHRRSGIGAAAGTFAVGLVAFAALMVIAITVPVSPAFAQCIGSPVQTNQTCTNSGALTNTSTSAGSNVGLQDLGSLKVTNTNAGTITGTGTPSGFSDGVLAAQNATVTNSGIISGLNAGINVRSATVINSGTVLGGMYGNFGYGILLFGGSGSVLVNSDLRLGGFIGGGNTSTVVDFNSGSAASDILFAGTYGRYKIGDAFLDFVVQGGHSQNSTIRNINNNLVAGGQETATASFGGWFISPELAFGERFALPDNWSLTPAARVRYVAAEFAGFTESGSTANLTVGDRMLQDVEERGDLTLTHTMTTANWGQSSLSIHAGVLDLQRTGGDSVNAILLGEALAFATPGKSNVGGVYVGGGFEWCALQRVAVFATGEYVAMSDSSSTVTGKAGLRVGF